MKKGNLINLLAIAATLLIACESNAQTSVPPSGHACKCSAEVAKEKSLAPLVEEAEALITEMSEYLKNQTNNLEIDEVAINTAIENFAKGRGWTKEKIAEHIAEIVADAASPLVEASKKAITSAIEDLEKQAKDQMSKFNPKLKFVATYNHPCNQRDLNEWLGKSANRYGSYLWQVNAKFGVGFGSGASIGIEANLEFKLEAQWGMKIEHERPRPVFAKDESPDSVTVVAKPQYTKSVTKGVGGEAFIKANVDFTTGDAKDLENIEHVFTLPEPCKRNCQ